MSIFCDHLFSSLLYSGLISILIWLRTTKNLLSRLHQRRQTALFSSLTVGGSRRCSLMYPSEAHRQGSASRHASISSLHTPEESLWGGCSSARIASSVGGGTLFTTMVSGRLSLGLFRPEPPFLLQILTFPPRNVTLPILVKKLAHFNGQNYDVDVLASYFQGIKFEGIGRF